MVVEKQTLSSSQNYCPHQSQRSVQANSSQQQQLPNYHNSQQFRLNPPQPQIVEWKNTFNMRKENLKNMPTCKLNKNIASIASKESALVAKSLNLLRQNLQPAINKELQLVISSYIQKFFEPAVENLKNNFGPQCVSEENVKKVCRSILEDAKQMYLPAQQTTVSTGAPGYSDSENSQNRVKSENEDIQSASKKKVRSAPVPRIPKADNIRREAPKWDPERINKETLFVMGSRANKAMGFGPTRGRLYIKHPELFRYSGDQEDKEWLVRHSLMPPTGQKAYIMIIQDIVELANSEEYRESPNLMLQELKGFEAPDSMLQKVKSFMQHMRTDLPGGHRRYKRPTVQHAPFQQPQQVPEMQNYLNFTEDNRVVLSNQQASTVDSSYFSQAQRSECNLTGQMYQNALYVVPQALQMHSQMPNYSVVWSTDQANQQT
ncbi:deoxynucleotidyltransferase terminal-interacting protein 1 [Neocloeon triangulifer]|uniref:deoxynucleotidyltransferase terminal-interacting protein 1 n=1 Tax=Neocloeon triangulifer TaxID=2078957 RepID=UPI00286EC00F|nr:deoxynucleotidyltransferase terminal-interacting protein 1 [Neocloeon triangulifer]